MNCKIILTMIKLNMRFINRILNTMRSIRVVVRIIVESIDSGRRKERLNYKMIQYSMYTILRSIWGGMLCNM